MASVSELLVRHFFWRPDKIAVAKGTAFVPVDLPPGGLKPEWVEARHLSGRQCLGSYIAYDDNTCTAACVDLDNKESRPDPAWIDKLVAIYYAAVGYGIEPLVEISHSGRGAHVWVHFDEPVPLALARTLLTALAEAADVPVREIFPRQDRVEKLGSLVRMPLFGQSRFFNCELMEDMEPLEGLQSIRLVDEETITSAIVAITGRGPIKPSQQPPEPSGSVPAAVEWALKDRHSRLARLWQGVTDGPGDPTPSGMAFALVKELIRLYLPTDDIKAALREWGKKHQYKKVDRPDWVELTVKNAYSRLTVNNHRPAHIATFTDVWHQYCDVAQEGITRLPFGIEGLDASVEGVGFGELCIIAARPGHGKSLVGMQMALTAARAGIPSLIMSAEMSAFDMGIRLQQRLAGPDLEVTPDLRQRVAAELSSRSPVYFVNPVKGMDHVEQSIDQCRREKGIELVVVDYLQLIRGGARSIYEEVSDVSRRLKLAAQEHHVAVVALTQMNREVDKRDGGMPMMSDLRDSGAIEQDADMIVFVQYLAKHPAWEGEDWRYRMYVGKRRNGRIVKNVIDTCIWANRSYIGFQPPDTVMDPIIQPQDLP